MKNDLTATRVGFYQVEMDEAGDLALARLPADDWQQLTLPQVDGFQEDMVDPGGHGDGGWIQGAGRLSIPEEGSLSLPER